MTAFAELRLRTTLEALRRPKPVGIAGVFLGLLAFWIALPPAEVRTLVWPLLVAAVAVGAGARAIAGDERRLGWGAVVAGVLGAGGAALALQSSTGKLEIVFVWSALIAQMLRFATPLTFAAIGGMFSERSGVINIALEGMMLMGAFFAIFGADRTGSWLLGLLIAMLAGGALALLYAFFAIHLRADQIVGGTAINFLALGITGYLFIDIYGPSGTPSSVSSIPDVKIPGISGVAFIGPAFGQLNLMIWIAIAVLLLSYVVLFRTPIGLRIRACGEHPRAADTVGIDVYRVRYGAVVLSGVLASLGGAYLSIGFVHSFNENMTAGRGFIGLAAMIFGKWRPFGAFGAALLFGFSTALAFQLPTYSGSAATLFQALPYILTLIAVAGVIGRSIPPAADGRPYVKQ